MEHSYQTMRRVVGEMRVGSMALYAVHGESAGQTAAPTDLDHVAEKLRAGRFADEAGIDDFASRREPIQDLPGAIDRIAFLVTGDQEADRSGKVAPALAEKF